MTLTLGSLFAGIGGFDLGFERAGFKTLWQCEIDTAAQGVLRRHFPEAQLHSDVREVGAHNLAPVDVLTFGSPCQDLSVAGKRAGLAGERSGLFHEAARIIRELRARYGKPDFAIWENVPGAFSSNEGQDFAAVVQTMVDLRARDICWRVLDSRFFGVAQRRRRVFLVADFGGERAEQILFESDRLCWNSATGRKPWEKVAEGVGDGAASSGSSFRILRTDEYRADTVASTVSARDYKSATDLILGQGYIPQVAGCLDGEAHPGSYNGQDAHNDRIIAQPIAFHPTQDPISSQNGVTHAMSNGSKGGQSTVAICATGEITHALTCTAQKGATEDGTGRGVPLAAHLTPMQVRRLTPRECEKLQGFPVNHTLEVRLPNGSLKEQADGPRYKQLGNAVTVNVAHWLANRVAATLKH